MQACGFYEFGLVSGQLCVRGVLDKRCTQMADIPTRCKHYALKTGQETA